MVEEGGRVERVRISVGSGSHSSSNARSCSVALGWMDVVHIGYHWPRCVAVVVEPKWDIWPGGGALRCYCRLHAAQ